ncbi:MAG: DUF2953 domain-containing protein [Clostridiales bacterium]|nr:DUF2953 domain-containing protein [Clostridiales bacterium]
MKAVIVIAAAVLVLLILLLIIPVRLIIVYDRDAVKNETAVNIKYLFFKIQLCPQKGKNDNRHKAKKSPKADELSKEPFSFENKKAELEKYIKIFETIKSDAANILQTLAERAMVFDRVEINADFGFEDAMQTGIFTGLLNGFVYGVLGFIHHHSTVKDMNVRLQPVFGKKCFNCHIMCILRLKTAHIIVVAVSVLKLYRKIKREGSI